MVEWRFYLRSSWRCHPNLAVLFAGTSVRTLVAIAPRHISSFGRICPQTLQNCRSRGWTREALFHPGLQHSKGWAECSFQRLYLSQQGTSPQPGLKRKRSAVYFQFKGLTVGSTLHSQVEHGTGRMQGPSSVRSFDPGPEIQRLCQEGQLEKALDALFSMDQQGIVPSVEVYRSLLKACSRKKATAHAKRVHAHLFNHGLEPARFLGESVVCAFVKCGDFDGALQVFERLPQQTVVSWTAVISGYTNLGQGKEALKMYTCMLQAGLEPDKYTFVSLLKACGRMSDLEEGKRIHADAVKYRCDSDLFVGTCLVDMYAKCGSIVDANHVFMDLSKRDVVSWNAMLAASALHGHADKTLELYTQMLEEGVSPSDRTFVSVLQACGILAEKEDGADLHGCLIKVVYLQKGNLVHAEAWKRGYQSDVFVGSTLVSMYGKCGSIVDAQAVFDELSHRDVPSWNAMLVGYASQGEAEKAIELYQQMLEAGVIPTDRTFVTLLQACSMLAEKDGVGVSTKQKLLTWGKVVHGEAWRRGYMSDVFVGSALVSMYGKCGSIVDAQDVFDGLSQRNVVSWNAILSGYHLEGQAEKALQLYEQMLQEGVSPNDGTFVSVLQACGILAEKGNEVVVDGQWTKPMLLQQGRAIHAEVWDRGYESDVFVCSSLVSLYGKAGNTEDAQEVFDGSSHRNLVLWNAMLTAYAQQGQGEKALHLYVQMVEEGVTPDDSILVCLLQACGNAGDLEMCTQIDQGLVSLGNGLSPLVASTLIHAYGQCARMEEAQDVFNTMVKPDVVAWTALLAGYARQGNYDTSLDCFDKMQLAGVKPNGVTFLSLISAYSRAGMVDKGIEYFESMTRVYGIAPETEHYTCMVDLLGRAGYFTMVEDLLSRMPTEPGLSIWLCLLSACRKHGNVELGRRAFDCAVRLQPHQSSAYVLMMNLYAQAGMWDCAMQVDELRQNSSAWKMPGQSWIGQEHEVEALMVGEHKHPQQEPLDRTHRESRL